MTPSAAIGVSDAAMTMPNTGMSSMTMFRLKAKIAKSAVTATAPISPARNTVTKPILTAWLAVDSFPVIALAFGIAASGYRMTT